MIESNLRYLVIQEALKHINKKAMLSNREFDCFDCEQFVNVVYKDLFNISIRENGFGKSSTTKVFTSDIGILKRCNNLQKQEKIDFIKFSIKSGDILFFHTQDLEEIHPSKENRYPGHIGIYLGEYFFIHARVSKGIVLIESLLEEDFLDILVGSKDIITNLCPKESFIR